MNRYSKMKLNHPISYVGVGISILGVAGFMMNIAMSGLFNINPFAHKFIGNQLIILCWILVPVGFAITGIGNLIAYIKGTGRTHTGGIEGEKRTAHQLKFLDGYKVFNNVDIFVDGKKQQFDHIVIGPAIFHIDTKHYKGSIKFTDKGMVRSQGKGEDPTN